MNNPNNPQFRSGAIWGASVTAIGAGLFFGRERNWALVALGAAGVYMARGGTISASSIPSELPENLPSVQKLRSLFPQGSAAPAARKPAWSINY
jgi:hypothetical protein